MTAIQEIPLSTITGEKASLADHAGKVLLLVNVASQCGLTPQYTALEALFEAKHEEGFEVLGFPANNFLGQEPGTDDEIAEFCSTSYQVKFPLFSKISVVGAQKHPLYRELISAQPERTGNGDDLREHLASYASENGLPAPNELPELLWNFEKFLVSRQGKVIARFAPDLTPDDPKLVSAIEAETQKRASAIAWLPH